MKRNPLCRVSMSIALGFGGLLTVGMISGCESTPRESATIPPVSTPTADGSRAGNGRTDIDVARAGELMAEAQAHMDNAEWRAARDAYRRAIVANPLDEGAIAGHDRALAMMDQGSSIDRVARELTLRRQQTIDMYDAAVEGAYDAMMREDLGEARRRLFEARARLTRNEDVLRQDEYEVRLFAVDTALEKLDKAQELQRLTRNGE